MNENSSEGMLAYICQMPDIDDDDEVVSPPLNRIPVPSAASSPPIAAAEVNSKAPPPVPVVQEVLAQTIRNLVKETKKDDDNQTEKAYNPKIAEFKEYCDFQYGGIEKENGRYKVNSVKAHSFIYYHAFREQKKRGKKRKGDILLFNTEEYVNINNAAMKLAHGETMKEPTLGLNYQMMVTYRCALQNLLKDQIDNGVTTETSELIFGKRFQTVMKMVKERKNRQNKKNYKEKIDSNSSPMQSAEHTASLEEWFFNNAIGSGWTTIYASLRNRFTFLYTVKGILRGESMYKAELSDSFGIYVNSRREIHPFYLDVMQIATGKTNKDLKLYGRVGRHINPIFCPVGAKGFYLLYRFEHSNEFDIDNLPDFHNNSEWFDIKLLTDSTSKDNKKILSNASYGKMVQKACTNLQIHSNHFVHIGRVMGSFESELDGDEHEDLRVLGNWDPKTQEKSYSTKLPMRILKSRAGFQEADGLHFNPRTTLEPPDSLMKMIFPWLDVALEEFNKGDVPSSPTGYSFLKMMGTLRKIILQDAAAMIVQNPERAAHPIFEMDVFKTEEFSTFVRSMKVCLENSPSPLDSNLEVVLPGVHRRLDTIQGQVDTVYEIVKEGFSSMKSMIRTEIKASLGPAVRECIREVMTDIVQNMASGIQNGAMLATTGMEVNANFQTTNTTIAPLQNNFARPANSAPIGTGHKLASRRAPSVAAMYKEWYGLEEFEGVPIEGGIDALEKQWGTKWRSGYTGAMQKRFSKRKMIITAISKAKTARGDDTIEKTISALEEDYKNAANESNFVEIYLVKEYGYHEKKQRKTKNPAT